MLFLFFSFTFMWASCADTNASHDINITKLFKTPLEPTHEDFKACFYKNKKAFIKINGVDAIAIDKHHAISFQKPKKFLRYDPFFKLYLIHQEKKLEPARLGDDSNLSKKDTLGSLTKARIAYGKFKNHGTLYKGADTLMFRDRKGSMIVDGCCLMYGVGKGDKSFIPNRYLKRLLANKSGFYGDIGANFYSSKRGVFISSLDPYRAKTLCIGDEIVSVNGIPITSKNQLLEMILFADKGSTLALHVRRGGKMREVEVTPFLRPKYPYRDSTYLRQTGMVFGKNLTLLSVPKKSYAYESGLRKGDRLMEIDFKKVKTTKDIRKALFGKKSGDYHLLFTRDDFQFFINMNRKDAQGKPFELPNCPAI